MRRRAEHKGKTEDRERREREEEEEEEEREESDEREARGVNGFWLCDHVRFFFATRYVC
jgi:hypothetical protein